MVLESGNRLIYITDYDLKRLKNLIDEAKLGASRDSKHIRELEGELDRAKIVLSKNVPPDVITMNSKVVLEDVDTREEMTLILAFPAEADLEDDRISVLAPIGTAIIGYRKDDVIEWEVPAGIRRLKVRELLYQPESAGDFNL